MRKSRKNLRKRKPKTIKTKTTAIKTRKNKCVYTDETKRIIGLMNNVIKNNKKHSKTRKSN